MPQAFHVRAVCVNGVGRVISTPAMAAHIHVTSATLLPEHGAITALLRPVVLGLPSVRPRDQTLIALKPHVRARQRSLRSRAPPIPAGVVAESASLRALALSIVYWRWNSTNRLFRDSDPIIKLEHASVSQKVRRTKVGNWAPSFVTAKPVRAHALSAGWRPPPGSTRGVSNV